MESIWLLLGIVVLAAILADVFLTALNYDEAGFISGRLTRLQWSLLRRVTRRLPRRWRPVGLRQVTGLQIVLVILAWLFGLILGFGLIYYGQMSRSTFSVSGRGAGLSLFDALYFSAAQLATVGGSSLTAESDPLRFLSIAESLSGVVLISLILTFLLGVYGVIGDLNSLCRYFFTAERGAGSAEASLAPFFHDGEPSGLDGHLDGIAGSFSSYVDGLRLHHAAYYFQSGRDHFALPYATRMLAGTIGALRWGLPSGHPASTEPGLVPLTFQFLEFAEFLERSVPGKDLAVPEIVSAEEFGRLTRGDHRGAEDTWVGRFVRLDAAMARLARLEPLADPDDAYARYREWLPFAFRAQQVTLAVSEDLDYQPLIVSRPDVPSLQAPAGPPLDPRPGLGITRWRAFVGAHLAQTDPGFGRLRAAVRAVVAAAGAVALVYLLYRPSESMAIQFAVFGGFVAMWSAGLGVGGTRRARQVTSLVVIVPIAAVVLLSALVADSVLLTAVLVVLVAVAGVAAARFGPGAAAIGRVTFMAYYFSLILRLDTTEVGYHLGAAVVGVVVAFLVDYVLLPERGEVVLRGGVEGLTHQLTQSVESLVDAVSLARWDPAVRRHVGLDGAQLRRHAAFLAGMLSREESETGVPRDRAAALRLRLFDVELAVTALALAARDVTGTTISLELRARLAGRLEELRAHLARLPVTPPGTGGPVPSTPWAAGVPDDGWPRPARALYVATDDLGRAATSLQAAAIAALDPSVPFEVPLSGGGTDPETGEVGTAPTPGQPRLSPLSRRTTQIAVATTGSLLVGELVSASHQYWATLCAYQVLGETDGETFVKGARRVLGTVAGAAFGFAIALSDLGQPWFLLPMLAVAVFAQTYYRPVSPAFATFWVTTIFALLYEYLGRLTTVALEQRILETLLGAVVALVVAFVVLPTHTRTALDRSVVTLLQDVDALVAGSLGRLAGGPVVPQPVLRRHLLAADQHVRAVISTAAPLRRALGALEVGGVEDRLTAAWSLTEHVRALVGAAKAAEEAGVGPTAQDWGDLARATSVNVAALTTALAGRLPGPVEEEVGALGDDETRPEVAAVLREVTRINQTLLLLLGDVSPGATSVAGTDEELSRS